VLTGTSFLRIKEAEIPMEVRKDGRAGISLGLALIAISILACLLFASSARASNEYEPNDTRETAFGPLEGGKSYTATFETENDVDWYVFYIKTYSQMDFTASTSCDGAWHDVSLGLMDLDGKGINGLEAGQTSETNHLRLTLNPGRYYLQTDNLWGECTGEQYHFQINPAASVTASRDCGEAIVAKDSISPELTAVNKELAENAEQMAEKAAAVHEAKKEFRLANKKVQRLRKRHRPARWIHRARGQAQQVTTKLNRAKEARLPVWQEKLSLEGLVGQRQLEIASAEAQMAAHC
jgi:hypothetical protein